MAETPDRASSNDLRPAEGSRLSILLLADDHPGHANTVLDHIDALRRHSVHRVHLFNPRGLRESRFLRLDDYDAVVIHYSLLVISDQYLAPAFRDAISRYSGLKVQFIQDEYRWIDEVTATMEYLGIDVIFSAAAAVDLPRLYTDRLPRVRAVTTLTGYVPDRLLRVKVPPLDQRPIDVGYRGRVVPPSLGALGYEKVRIAKGFRERAGAYGLRCDIRWREEDRIYGERWNQFVASCKAMLGTESGASIADFDGVVERAVNDFLAERPEASFEEIHEAVLRPFEGNLEIRSISPRVFEAVALRTALVQFPGDYSGVIEPWKHYIVLEEDFSNMDEVVSRLGDARFLREMTECARADVAESGLYSYRAFAREFDQVVTPLVPDPRRGSRRSLGYPIARWERSLADTRSRLAQLEVRLRPRALGVQRLSGTSAWRAMRLAARMAVLVRAAWPHPPIRRLVALALRGGDRAETLADVLRLAVLAEAARDPAKLGFRPTAHLESESLLRFTSRQVGDRSRSQVDWPAAERAVQAGRLRVVWSHAAVGNAFAYPLLGPKWLRFHVGRENPSVHSFDRLAAMARAHPGLLVGALRLVESPN